MKTKHQICVETKVPMTTFNFWLNKGLLPKPAGILKRSAVWEDNIIETVTFIQAQQEKGMSLGEIKDAMPGYYLERMNHAQSRLDFLKEWMDLPKARAELADLFGCDLAGADIMLSESARAWVVSIDGPTVTLAEVERINHVIVHSAVVSLEDYIAIETASIRSYASAGRVKTEHTNLAFRVFEGGEDIKAMVEKAQKINGWYQ